MSFKAGILATFVTRTAHFIQKTSTPTILWFGVRED
jgi:ABC-type bacteriocin/lantibiotic exporter with double-glycine peptidase domain